MKKKKDKYTFLIVVILIFAGVAISGYLRNFCFENSRLQRDFDQLNRRIKDLEADNTMQRIVALRVENCLLRGKLCEFQRMCAAACQKKGESGKKASVAKPRNKASSAALLENKPGKDVASAAKGNRGYIFEK